MNIRLFRRQHMGDQDRPNRDSVSEISADIMQLHNLSIAGEDRAPPGTRSRYRY